MDPAADITVTDAEIDKLIEVADLVTRIRTAVERDFQGSPQFAHALEMPTRFSKQLVQIVRGGIALGMPRDVAMAAAMRGAGDSIPPRRLSVLGDVSEHARSFTGDVVKRLQLPRKTVDRALQELHLLGLLTVDEVPWGPASTRWAYTLADGIDQASIKTLMARKGGQICHHPLAEATPDVPNLARNVTRGDERTAP